MQYFVILNDNEVTFRLFYYLISIGFICNRFHSSVTPCAVKQINDLIRCVFLLLLLSIKYLSNSLINTKKNNYKQ